MQETSLWTTVPQKRLIHSIEQTLIEHRLDLLLADQTYADELITPQQATGQYSFQHPQHQLLCQQSVQTSLSPHPLVYWRYCHLCCHIPVWLVAAAPGMHCCHRQLPCWPAKSTALQHTYMCNKRVMYFWQLACLSNYSVMSSWYLACNVGFLAPCMSQQLTCNVFLAPCVSQQSTCNVKHDVHQQQEPATFFPFMKQFFTAALMAMFSTASQGFTTS